MESTSNHIDELIGKKLEKEANRYIRQWPEEKISIENGRWGPFIRFGKKMLKLGRRENGEKFTADELKEIPLEDIKKMVETQVPGAFTKKATAKKATAKKATAKKAAAKKGAAKKTATQKTAAKKAAAKKKK